MLPGAFRQALDGAPHGVQMFVDSGVARRWNQIVTEWLGLQLRRA